MIYSARIHAAIQFAINAHAGQTRKGKDIPYITHPFTVALILSRAGAEEDVIIAGMLHDTVEDSDGAITLADIQKHFGDEVTELVRYVTEEDKSLPWAERKRQALAHIKVMPHNALLLKSADVLHNLSDLLGDLEQYGDSVFEKFNAPKEQKIIQQQKLVEALEFVWPENPLLSDIKTGVEKLVRLSEEKNHSRSK